MILSLLLSFYKVFFVSFVWLNIRYHFGLSSLNQKLHLTFITSNEIIAVNGRDLKFIKIRLEIIVKSTSPTGDQFHIPFGTHCPTSNFRPQKSFSKVGHRARKNCIGCETVYENDPRISLSPGHGIFLSGSSVLFLPHIIVTSNERHCVNG